MAPLSQNAWASIQWLYADRLAAKAVPFASVEDEVIGAPLSVRLLGVKLGVISNCAHEEVAAWPTCRLRPLFDDAVFSSQVGCVKPASEIYLTACERLGVAPRRSVFVGNGDSNELEGAVRVGMNACWATWFLDRWPESCWSHT